MSTASAQEPQIIFAQALSYCQPKEGITPLHLLVVEDNPSDVLHLQNMLDHRYPGQYETTVAATLGKAQSLLGKQVFEAVLLDLSLPDSEGLETITKLAAAAPHLPIVVLTGVAEEKIAPEAVRCGAQDYLIKGLSDSTAIARVIRYAIDRKRAEETLAQDRNLLRTLIDNLTDCIYVKDVQGRFIAANLATAHLMGVTTPNDLLGKSDFDFYPPELAAEYRADEAELLHSGQPLLDKHEPHLDANGNLMSMLTTKVPLKDDLGKIVGLVGISRDITERKRLLAEAKAATETANEAKSRFLDNISHELLTPMNAILGMIDVALSKLTDPTVQDCLQTARGSGDLLLALLNDLLDLSRIEAGKLELKSAPFSLRSTLDKTTQVMAARAREKRISFSCHIPPEVPDALVGDPLRLRQVLFSLTENGIKFTERGEVSISVRVQSQGTEEVGLEFAVWDTGIGIPPSRMDHLFHPFAQVLTSPSRRLEGTGLGLPISQSLVAMMGGRIWAESEEGKGSTFYFTVQLPLAAESPTEGEASFDAAKAAPCELRILLVEDNAANQKLATYILQDRGHFVEIAGDGQEAIYLTEQNRYDVIVMDMQMPEMDGLEATRLIRKREAGGSHVPIIALTAHATRENREQCLAAGMDGYLAKPVNGREMIALVESLVAGEMAADAGTASKTSRPAESMNPTSAAFDPELALKRCFNNPHMVRDMIRFFFDEVESLFPQMHATLQKGDLVKAERLEHRLKGTLLYLGAQPALEAALRLERFCKSSGSAPSEAEEAVNALEHECILLKALLSKHPLAAEPKQSD